MCVLLLDLHTPGVARRGRRRGRAIETHRKQVVFFSLIVDESEPPFCPRMLLIVLMVLYLPPLVLLVCRWTFLPSLAV